MNNQPAEHPQRTAQRKIIRTEICEFADGLTAEGFAQPDVITEFLFASVSMLVANIGQDKSQEVLNNLVLTASEANQKALDARQRPN